MDMTQFTAKPKPVKRSWKGGPLIQCHRPMWDSSLMYVCDKCLQVARTGVRAKMDGPDRGKWLCASCETGKARRTQSGKQATGIL